MGSKSGALRQQQYAARHPDRIRLNVTRQKARLRAIRQGVSITKLKAVKAIYARAAELRRWFDVQVDHIIPLAKGGAHSPSNLQIIYRVENTRKGARMHFVPSVVFC